MPAGTIALTNNSATVTGTGTSFTTEFKVGDFVGVIVGSAPYTMVVASIASNTQLTLSVPFNGPSASGLAWYAVPASLKIAISQQTLNDIGTNARGMILQMDNWQKIYSDAASVTVTRTDRSTFTGPSWGYMAAQYSNKANKGANSDITSLSGLTTPLSLAQGGLGANNAAGARNTLGLGSAAQRDAVTSQVDATAGRLLQVGSFGIGAPGQALAVSDTSLLNFIFKAGIGQFYRNAYDTAYGFAYGASIVACAGDTYTNLCAGYGGAGVRVTAGNATTNGVIYNLYTDRNTTKASDGTLKAASPVARIVCSQDNTQRADVAEAGFSWCGCGTANEEAEGITLSRLEAGVYVLTGSAGLATEGWQLLPPRDPKGSGDLGIVEAEQTESGGLKISLFKRRYKLTDDGDIEVVKGDLIDVPANSWIDVRLDMPEDSAYNRRQAEMQSSAVDDDHQAGS
ncbi:hypothetical protein [Pantoea sp. GM01]|uniref:phage tail fiber protein n=1 Tax=Pantoea sp. GM01 TaxID=1144320 RepID=UPI000270F858|nr:hypothetical protein [Pantoea sp. GM01]EJL90205.1 hypothetical protein PMI17_01725 [Pantoea sp. GM01]